MSFGFALPVEDQLRYISTDLLVRSVCEAGATKRRTMSSPVARAGQRGLHWINAPDFIDSFAIGASHLRL